MDDSSSQWRDPVIEAYKRDVDRTLLRQALRLTPDERLRELQRLGEFVDALRAAGGKQEKRG